MSDDRHRGGGRKNEHLVEESRTEREGRKLVHARHRHDKRQPPSSSNIIQVRLERVYIDWPI